jgi:lysosomal Pro-X carboxypeptidase
MHKDHKCGIRTSLMAGNTHALRMGGMRSSTKRGAVTREERWEGGGGRGGGGGAWCWLLAGCDTIMACALLFLASFLPLMRGVEAGRGPRGLLENHCKEEFLEQPLDHFNHGEQRTFRQRYFVCQAPGASSTSSSRALFFYTGNEANVELYVEATGLMWEMAPDFGAMLVFAEHRYYGKSVPDIPEGRAFLSAVQALADYAELIHFIRDTMNRPLPAVCFGGSYGGMLCYWLRAFHPGAVSGAIAASAPVVAFEGLSPRANPYAYHEIVTAVADQYGLCSSNTRQFFRNVLSLGQTAAGRDKIASAMNLCHPLKDPSEATSLALWIQSAWDFIAMGNFPYASSYITNGEGVLPPWPMAAACASLEGELEGSALLAAMGSAVGVFYNATKDLDCLPHGE